MAIVSVIIPFYNGNEHLKKLKNIFESNASNLAGEDRIEVIIVNDSPWIRVKEKLITSNLYIHKIINHDRNRGIHQARVTGIENAKGDYIYLFDQDDSIKETTIKVLLKTMKKNRVACVIGNGIYDTNNSARLIMDSCGKVVFAQNYAYYLILGNLLSSPGQCLIKKESIPVFWMKNIVKSNCSDDLFLWILLLKNSKITYCNEIVYRHIDTGINLSLNIEKGLKSDLEVLDYLKKSGEISPFLLGIFKLRYQYRSERLKKKNKNIVIIMLYSFISTIVKLYRKFLDVILRLQGYKVPKLHILP